MPARTILLTGATAGIGLETAKKLVSQGHRVLLHGRDQAKLDRLADLLGAARTDTFCADLCRMSEVEDLASAILRRECRLDVLINNAGVFKTPNPTTESGLDARFAVNTLAPYMLTKRLLPLLGPGSRVVNLSSAAQAPIDLKALVGPPQLADMPAYAQSKLGITMWTRALAEKLGPDGPMIVSVNPGSLLDTKMVREGFGVEGADVGIGADILVRAALSDEFSGASGKYFDNDAGRFASPHPEAMDRQKSRMVVRAMEAVLGLA